MVNPLKGFRGRPRGEPSLIEQVFAELESAEVLERDDSRARELVDVDFDELRRMIAWRRQIGFVGRFERDPTPSTAMSAFVEMFVAGARYESRRRDG